MILDSSTPGIDSINSQAVRDKVIPIVEDTDLVREGRVLAAEEDRLHTATEEDNLLVIYEIRYLITVEDMVLVMEGIIEADS